MLSSNQRVAVGLAGAAAGLVLARKAIDDDDAAARVVRLLGRLHVSITDSILGVWDGLGSWQKEVAEERRKAEERAWGREHTRPARIVKREYS